VSVGEVVQEPVIKIVIEVVVGVANMMSCCSRVDDFRGGDRLVFEGTGLRLNGGCP